MKSFSRGLVLVALSGLVSFASDAAVKTKSLAKGDPEEGRKVVFSLMPRSFQRSPELDFNVMTEMTAEGRKRGEPTSGAPVYFAIQGGERRQSGDAVNGGPAPTVEAVRRWVLGGLAKRHYLEAKEGGPRAALVLIYHWGSHESPVFDGEEGETDEAAMMGADAGTLMLKVLGSERKRKALIDRALLVGGVTFAQELNRAMNEEAAFRRANDTSTRAAETMGLSSLTVEGMLSPFHRYMERDAKTRRLVEESFGGLFYVIVSAFDYNSVASGKPVLLWRTNMSANSSGVSLVDVTQPLIAAGADYIGRETDGGILLVRKIDRQGSVKIGEGEVIETIEEPQRAAPEKK